MIGKQIIGKDFYGVLMYNQKKVNKGEAIVLHTNLSSDSVVMQTQELNIVRQLKPNLSKAVYHVSLNLPYSDSNKLTNEEFTELATDYLEGMNFYDNQFIIYKHFDQDHSHIHIIANRVCFSGNVVSDSQDYKRSETLIRRLEKKFNLTELVRKQESNVLSKGEIEKCLRTGESPHRLELQNIINELLKHNLEMSEFLKQIKGKNIEVKLNKSNTGKVSGISFKYKNTTYKGSKIHRNLSWNNLTKQLKNNEQERNHNSISTLNTGNRKIGKETNSIVRTIPRNGESNIEESKNNLGEIKGNKIIKNTKFRFKK